MAKDVDLSSHKWRELIFEGKNKEFGAYQLRKNSGDRHNKSVIIVMGVLAVILTVIILLYTGVISFEEADANAGIDQEAVMNIDGETEEEEVVEEEFIPEQEPEPEPEPEVKEVASVQHTEINIVDDDKLKQEIKPIDTKSDAMTSDKDNVGDPEIAPDFDDGSKQGPPAPPPAPEANNTPPPPPPPPAPAPDPDENKVFTTVEQKASYPGGDAALLAWINSNIVYPPMAVEDDAQGRVIVSFVVEKDGSITDIKVARGRHPELDKEAMRVVSKIPKKFVPAKQNGKNVRYKFNLPVTFKLSK